MRIQKRTKGRRAHLLVTTICHELTTTTGLPCPVGAAEASSKAIEGRLIHMAEETVVEDRIEGGEEAGGAVHMIKGLVGEDTEGVAEDTGGVGEDTEGVVEGGATAIMMAEDINRSNEIFACHVIGIH